MTLAEKTRATVPWWMLLGISLVAPSLVSAQVSDDRVRASLSNVAEQLVSPERCSECHASEFDVWRTTPHATGFNELHRRDSAKAIYESLGLRTIKRGNEETTPACLECHYTPEVRRGALRAGNGVTCESCHGPARDWVDVHSDYGVGGADRQAAARAETAEHRQQRIANAIAAGMRRPSQLYGVAANCFGCHTVPNEEIVNIGNHTTGGEFELVERSQGDIRHNFLESLKTGDGTVNADRAASWKRRMYVVGRAVDFEYSLRGVARATEPGRYLDSMSGRVGSALDSLAEMTEFASLPEIDSMLAIYDQVDLVPNNAVPLDQAADRVQAATRAFLARSDGSELGALDLFWDPDAPAPTPSTTAAPGPDRTLPSDAGAGQPPATPPVNVETATNTEPSSEPGDTDRATPPPPEPISPSSEEAPSPSIPAAPRYPINARPSWRTPPEQKFVKSIPCGGCHEHAKQTEWYQTDPHSSTIDPFKTNSAESQAIAQAYGVAVGDMRKGSQTCMWCHGTITSSPRLDVRNSVGCQMCHGAGKVYEKSHETESYSESLAKGLTDLKNVDTRAATCAGCHLITDPGLLAAGHNDGTDFNIADRMTQITHWGPAFGGRANDLSGSALTSAYGGVLSARPVPAVTVVQQPVAATASRQASSSPTGSAAVRQPGQTAVAAAAPPTQAARAQLPDNTQRTGLRPTAASVTPPPDVAPPVDAVLPELGDDTPIERILLRLKEHLESLYQQLGRGSP